jgi:hypothetical protein
MTSMLGGIGSAFFVLINWVNAPQMMSACDTRSVSSPVVHGSAGLDCIIRPCRVKHGQI